MNPMDRPKAAVIDDDSFFAQVVSEMLLQRKYLPAIFYNFEDAIEALKNSEFALVMADIFMPGIGGLEGIKIYREHCDKARIIAMSGGWKKMPPEKTIEAAIKFGADAGLAKPFNSEQLDEVLTSLSEPGS